MDKTALLRRMLSLTLLLTLFSGLLSGCAPDTKTISFMVFGEPAELAAYQTLVRAFQEEHPEILVNLVHIPSQSDYRTRVAADLAANTAADVLLFNYRRYAQFADVGALEPLTDYLEDSKLLKAEDFYPQALDPFRHDGQVYCIPQNLSSLVVYYNQDLFTQAGVAFPKTGWTWDDFLGTAQALTRDTNGDGQTDQFGLGIEPTLMRLAPFIWQNLGEVADSNINPTRLMLDMPENFDTIYFFTELQTMHHVVPNAEQEAAESSESRFLNGTVGMYLNSRRVVPTLRESAAFNWDVAPLPMKEEAASILHADGYCMPSASKEKTAAWIFIEFANSVEGQTIIAATGRTVPSLKSVAESPAFLNPGLKPASSQVFLDAIPIIRAFPILPFWAELEKITDDEIERAYYSQTTVPEAVQAIILRVEDVFIENAK
ncbi:MAG: sugar ABC transporter substrate-binding protein [Anaerolineales bacterium]|jgi:multiple sugar transport system substrate-binding protein|nr:sugar ABC transporter substrate-binding protein [Anaerolineales bacterium]